MAIRCKMRLDNVFRQSYGGIKAFFSCQYDQTIAKEDASFALATPQGTAEFVIDNPKAAEQLEIGAYYYVDFHPVTKPADATTVRNETAKDSLTAQSGALGG